MTTTISKHDLQQQQQQQQQQLLLLQQQQQQLLQLQQQHQQQQQQRFSQNTTYSLDNTITASVGSVATAATHRLDSITTTTLPNTIQIDTLNNNFENDFNTTLTLRSHATNNNNGDVGEAPPAKIQKKRSLLNFKSFDFHIKSLYSGLRNGSSNQNKSHSQATNLMAADGSTREVVAKVLTAGINANGSELNINELHQHIHQPYNRMPPYLKIESVDNEESENLLIDYPQSPYSSRRNSSNDDNRSSSQLIHLTGDGGGEHQNLLLQPTPHRYEMSRSQASSPSPYYLSPHAFASSSQNMRRSSTSDIMSGSKRSASSSTSNSRRPSTSDLLRKARERRGSETRMGRSVSHGGLPRGGSGGGGAFRVGPGIGGRRTSMAF
ncbi:putative mediator of RNA polymerase II transcription subunit 26 [Calliphora vicina]|uniref:putative mediator of RNA polymerase II transcription subunit 26 n=1 Tax=Calliphora vicina TaxID=7373 RepID=UPI00325AE906